MHPASAVPQHNAEGRQLQPPGHRHEAQGWQEGRARTTELRMEPGQGQREVSTTSAAPSKRSESLSQRAQGISRASPGHLQGTQSPAPLRQSHTAQTQLCRAAGGRRATHRLPALRTPAMGTARSWAARLPAGCGHTAPRRPTLPHAPGSRGARPSVRSAVCIAAAPGTRLTRSASPQKHSSASVRTRRRRKANHVGRDSGGVCESPQQHLPCSDLPKPWPSFQPCFCSKRCPILS